MNFKAISEFIALILAAFKKARVYLFDSKRDEAMKQTEETGDTSKEADILRRGR